MFLVWRLGQEQGQEKQEVPTGTLVWGREGDIPGRDSAPGRLGTARASLNFAVTCLKLLHPPGV